MISEDVIQQQKAILSRLALPLEAIEKANQTITLLNSSTVLGQSFAAARSIQLDNRSWKCWESIQGSLASLNAINQNLISVPPSVIQSVKNALLYMNESHREEFRRNILPQMEELSKEKKLSCSDWLSILSILVTILFELFSHFPDFQQTQIIQQNDVLIEQQAEQNRLDEQLVNTVQALADNIDLLCNELQHSGDLRQGMNDVHKPESQPDTKDSQQANRDVQD